MTKALLVAAKGKWKDALYIQREYNIDCFTSNPLSSETNVAVKLVNALIKALNKKECTKLPHIIVFVPDWDLVKFAQYYKPGAQKLFDKLLKWIMIQSECAIDVKKDGLARKKPGSVLPMEPKIIWPKMIERVGGEYDKALTVHYRFNAALEDQLASRSRHYIINVGKKIAEPNYFTPRNQLTDELCHVYWREIDHWIEEFDHDKDKLKPVKQIQFQLGKQHRKVTSTIALRSPHKKNR